MKQWQKVRARYHGRVRYRGPERRRIVGTFGDVLGGVILDAPVEGVPRVEPVGPADAAGEEEAVSDKYRLPPSLLEAMARTGTSTGPPHRKDCGCSRCRPGPPPRNRCVCGHPLMLHDGGCTFVFVCEGEEQPCGCKAYREKD